MSKSGRVPSTREAEKPAVQALDVPRQKGEAREDTSKQLWVGRSAGDRISGRGPSDNFLRVNSCGEASRRHVRLEPEQKKKKDPSTVPGAYTVFAPSVSQRDELRRQNKVCVIRYVQMPTCLTRTLIMLEHLQGDEAAIEKLRARKTAVTYTVPKGQMSVCLFPSSSSCFIPSDGGNLCKCTYIRKGSK